MKEISEKANLSRNYTNHQIRKTTATGLRKSGFTFEQIAHVTKHKNLDSLKHYVDGPTITDKENYNKGLFNYAKNNKSPKRASDEVAQTPAKKKCQESENFNNNNAITVPDNPLQIQPKDSPNVTSVVTNQLRQAPNLFQNATFTNCNFSFSLLQ